MEELTQTAENIISPEFDELLQRAKSFKDSKVYKSISGFLTYVSPSKDRISELVSQKSMPLNPHEFINEAQLAEFGTVTFTFQRLREKFKSQNQESKFNELFSETIQVRMRVIEILYRYNQQNDEEKKELEVELKSLYTQLYGTISPAWVEMQLQDERAQRVFQNNESCAELVVSVPNKDYYDLSDLKIFETLFIEDNGNSPTSVIYRRLYTIVLEEMENRGLTSASVVSSLTMKLIGEKVLDEMYSTVLPSLGIFTEDSKKFTIEVDPKKKTMSKDNTAKLIRLPDESRPLPKLVTLVFHEIATHLLKSKYKDLNQSGIKTDDYLEIEEAYCKLIESYYLKKIKKELQEGLDVDVIYEDNAAYAFAIALNKKGYTIPEVQSLVEDWYLINEKCNQPDAQDKSVTVIMRVYRGCIGDAVFPKDRAYVDGFRVWKKVFEIYQNGSEAEKTVLAKVCQPDLWMGGKYNPFDPADMEKYLRSGSAHARLSFNNKEVEIYYEIAGKITI